MATTTEAKAARLLTDGCVYVRVVRPGYVSASVRGDHGVWDVTATDGDWHCTCPAYQPRCSHILATQLVTTEPVQPEPAAPAKGLSAVLGPERPRIYTDEPF